MAFDYSIEQNLLNINGKQLRFQHGIRDVKEAGGFLVLLLAVPFNEMFLDNLYAVNQSGDIAWRVQDAG